MNRNVIKKIFLENLGTLLTKIFSLLGLRRRFVTEDKKLELVPLPERHEGHGQLLTSYPSLDGNLRPRDIRRRLLKLSFVVCVLVPGLVAAFYYTFIASNRYVAGAGFSVRGMDARVGSDLLGSFTGLASNGPATSDSYILLKFLKSRDLVEKLEARIPFREIYSAREGDSLSRLDTKLDIEHVVEYWDKRISTTFDNISGILTFEVEAFTPEDAERVASAVLILAKEMVNELSSKARQDAVAYANAEVEHAEQLLRTALDKLRQFRDTEKALDPAGAAKIQMEVIGGLEKKLSELNARITALAGEVAKDAPSLRNLRRQAQALKEQIASQRAEITLGEKSTQTALTGQLATYETLEVERDFAQKAYASALTFLEKSRVEADRQQRYLAVYSNPGLPQYPLYPRRMLNMLLIFTGLTLLWGIGTLIAWSVRDHLS